MAFEARLVEWSEAIERSHAEVRETPGGYDALVERLVSGSPIDKVSVIRQLGFYGSQAVPPLCAALKDPAYQVREAAAGALAALGDERAIAPLAEALKDCFEGRSALRNLLGGIGRALGMLVLLLVMVALSIVGQSVVGLHYWWGLVADWARQRIARTELVRVLTDALLQLCEQTESPELRRVLPDLKVVAVDVIRHGRQTRASSRTAVARIEALTSQLRDLPLPAASERPSVNVLPTPSQAPETLAGVVESMRV